MVLGIESADDLAAQSDIKYGTSINGSTYTFFKVGDAKILYRFI